MARQDTAPTITTKGGLGRFSVAVNGHHAGHVARSTTDGKFAALRAGKVLGRFATESEAAQAVAEAAS